MQGFIILAIIGTEKLIETEVDGRRLLQLDTCRVLTVLEKVAKKARNFGNLKYSTRVHS